MQLVFQQSSINEFNRTLKAIQDRSNRSAKSIVRQASYQFIRSIRAKTPTAPKMVKKPDWGLTEYGGYFVRKYNSKGFKVPFLAPNRQEADKLRRIKYYGAAKNVWWGVLRKMGRTNSIRYGLAGISKSFSGFRQGGQGSNFFMEMENRLRYINKIVSVSKANNALNSANNSLKKLFAKQYGSLI